MMNTLATKVLNVLDTLLRNLLIVLDTLSVAKIHISIETSKYLSRKMQKKQADIRIGDTSLIELEHPPGAEEGDGVATVGTVFLDGHGCGEE